MKQFIIISLFTFLSYTATKAQLIFDLPGLVDEISKSAVYIEAPDGEIGTGTAIMIPFSDTSNWGSTLIATTRHLTERYDNAGKLIISYDTLTVYFNLGEEKKGQKCIVIGRDEELDVAILQRLKTNIKANSFDMNAIPPNYIASINEIRKGQMAIIAGFPFGLGAVGSKLNPVVQSGIVALVDSLSDSVLVDISINLGNSGSPTFVITKQGPKLIGLVFKYQESSDLVFRPSVNKNAWANASLGKIVLISKILEELKKDIGYNSH